MEIVSLLTFPKHVGKFEQGTIKAFTYDRIDGGSKLHKKVIFL